MSQSENNQPATSAGDAREELARIPKEPLLPIEKKLIVGSLVLGFALLGLLIWLSYTYFPAP